MGAIQNAMGGLAATALGGIGLAKHVENQEAQTKQTQKNTEELQKLTSKFEAPKDEKGKTITPQGFMQSAKGAKGLSLNDLSAAMKATENLDIAQLGKMGMDNRIKANRIRIKARKGGKR